MRTQGNSRLIAWDTIWLWVTKVTQSINTWLWNNKTFFSSTASKVELERWSEMGSVSVCLCLSLSALVDSTEKKSGAKGDTNNCKSVFSGFIDLKFTGSLCAAPYISDHVTRFSFYMYIFYVWCIGQRVNDELLWVCGITSRYKFHTSRHPNFAMLILELLYAASFAQILDRNVLYSWFRGIKRNFLCWF